MTSLRTKVIIWCAGLIGLALATPGVLPKVLPYLLTRFSSRYSVIFVSVHFHPLPFIVLLTVWIVVVVYARISFLRDKRRGAQKLEANDGNRKAH